MRKVSAVPRLTDIIEAIDLIQAEVAGISLAEFGQDKRKRWIVERGLEIVSEASRHLPDELKREHSSVPWPKIAGIGNLLRHEYQRIAHDILWHVVHDNLSQLDEICRNALAREAARAACDTPHEN